MILRFSPKPDSFHSQIFRKAGQKKAEPNSPNVRCYHKSNTCCHSPDDIAAAVDCSSELKTGCGWVPVVAAVVGSPNVLAAAEVLCSEGQTQSWSAVAELKVLPQGSSSSSLLDEL
jgi:hypothetical protein